jgi:nucleotide-binding universal stress UspA family protein
MGWMKAALACAYRRAEKYLDVQRQEVCRQGIEVRTRVCDRSPAEAIVTMAVTEGVDLIVMSSRGRRDLAHWDTSMVADMVVRRSPCPVLLMDSDGCGESR